jgi:hypothetical protein
MNLMYLPQMADLSVLELRQLLLGFQKALAGTTERVPVCELRRMSRRLASSKTCKCLAKVHCVWWLHVTSLSVPSSVRVGSLHHFCPLTPTLVGSHQVRCLVRGLLCDKCQSSSISRVHGGMFKGWARPALAQRFPEGNLWQVQAEVERMVGPSPGISRPCGQGAAVACHKHVAVLGTIPSRTRPSVQAWCSLHHSVHRLETSDG